MAGFGGVAEPVMESHESRLASETFRENGAWFPDSYEDGFEFYLSNGVSIHVENSPSQVNTSLSEDEFCLISAAEDNKLPPLRWYMCAMPNTRLDLEENWRHRRESKNPKLPKTPIQHPLLSEQAERGAFYGENELSDKFAEMVRLDQKHPNSTKVGGGLWVVPSDA
eukprot:CAMPEP_0197536544 /NCGR_PEP_ID=MMETSP1318-20131121/54160_1 /TAXON_ID=552666 /ORGANISM="Partenskyella glossopodia, Strain RCC365" /LENGTH=166 /DNA_ID=CAMNT_0043094461 /DNA_START=273 /DNA_END=769 /DNA_ORIENTATION=+